LSAALLVVEACAPQVSAGEWQCRSDDLAAGGAAAGGSSSGGASAGGASRGPSASDPIPVPWADDFEDGFCGYRKSTGPGYCYGDAPYILVTEPHRPGGHFAAEFRVIGGKMNQTRCIRQGEYPESAFYGAWYYIPEALEDVRPAWNLWHFTGGDSPDTTLTPLWDVTLAKGLEAGQWELVVYDPITKSTYRGAEHKPVPIGSWFHIELFLKRASDSSGKVALYQDGALLFEQTNLKSDASKFSQWYVGNWAENATPADSSVFVDDLSFSTSLSPTSVTQ